MLFNSPGYFRNVFKQIKPISQNFSRYFQSTTQASVRSVTVQGQNAGSSFRSLSLLVGATTAVYLHSHNSKILNDTANLGTINVNDYKSKLPEVDTSSLPPALQSRDARKVQYKQLCYGSLTGLFFGVVIGKLSTVLGFISLSAVLLIQFLQSRGIVDIPWKQVIKIGNDRVDLKKLVLENPSFKWSFALTFVVAAFNI
ncbi:hypothetical protein WICPIJ_005618 [Wickerhamomyces pijperi]|uniref:FUN14 domain-containing protein n=1 Tax=Wickerhamomyces pijperi TaxID=599730 RepID=A0A9P8Q5X0_WICPI|nr:hypothetical protein WICPIJ_005618 [Wickerhamomyces pijperi]